MSGAIEGERPQSKGCCKWKPKTLWEMCQAHQREYDETHARWAEDHRRQIEQQGADHATEV